MKLLDVYETPGAADVLWQSMREVKANEAISHRGMPTYAEHLAYLGTRPHPHWYLIDVDGKSVGYVYLSKRREIGVRILRVHQGNDYGPRAIKRLMSMHPGKFLANINPKNSRSATMFKELGFTLIQVTYAK